MLYPALFYVKPSQYVWLVVWLMSTIKCHIDRRAIERATKKQQELGQKITLVDPSGLRLAVNSKSASWNYNYRKRGVDYQGKRHPQRTLRLGDTVSMTPQEARMRVAEIKAEVRNGGDPSARIAFEDDQFRLKELRKRPLGVWLHQYARSVLNRGTKHQREELMHVRNCLRELGLIDSLPEMATAKQLRDITHIHSEHPATGRHRFGAMSRFLDFLVDEEIIDFNPAKNVSRRHRPKSAAPREIYYSIKELQELWQPKVPLRQDYLRFLRFMIVCPLRMNEAAELKVSDICIAAAELRLSAEDTKNDEAFTLPIPPIGIEQLGDIEAAEQNKRCFQLSSIEGAPMKSWSYFNKAVRRSTGIQHFNLHHLRRTFTTMLSEHSQFTETLADSLLNHKRSSTRSGVMRHYQHAKNIQQRREVMKWWAEFLTKEVIDGSRNGSE